MTENECEQRKEWQREGGSKDNGGSGKGKEGVKIMEGVATREEGLPGVE